MNYLAIIFLMILPTSVFAAVESESTPINLREIAITESNKITSEKSSDLASDAQVSGVLNLNDDYSEIKTRSHLYTFSAELSPFTPRGTGRVGSSSAYSLEEAGSTLLPALSFGTLFRVPKIMDGKIMVGFKVRAAFVSQILNIQNSSGPLIPTRINSSALGVGPELRWDFSNKWASQLHAELGEHLTTSSSSNGLAQWTKNESYSRLGLAGLYTLTSDLSIKAGLIQNSIEKGINYEMGMEVLW